VGELGFLSDGRLRFWVLGVRSASVFGFITGPAEAVVPDFFMGPRGWTNTLQGIEGSFNGTVNSDTDTPGITPEPMPSALLLIAAAFFGFAHRRWVPGHR
jgi:hypothetical protein